jgi:DNA repair protein RecN (Recombination protein N)
MIDELHVHNVALIRDATIRFARGLTVLTGETGAGKSALLSSVKLLTGERADAGAVREGEDSLVVEGRFFLPEADPDGIIVSRRVEASGRSRVEVDGTMASVRELAGGVGATVDLCGQHEHQRLLIQADHADILDAWAQGSIEGPLEAYREKLDVAKQASSEYERVKQNSRTSAERLDEAEFVLRRIDAIKPVEGEYEQLAEKLPRAEHAESLISAAIGAHEAIMGDDGAEDKISSATSALREAARHDLKLAGFADTLESALREIEETANDLRSYCDEVEYDPAELDHMQSRMAELRGLLRSYGPEMQDVFARRKQASEIVEAAHDSGASCRRAKKNYEEAEAALAEAADKLDTARCAAAPLFSDAIGEQMASLNMGSAQVEVKIERLPRAQWSHRGPSRVELLYRPAATLSARPLRKIASGGEVSRVMLAIKVVLGDADGTDTLIFDEVDAGVGGTTAVALGELLSRLAKTHQVIVVTHLPQVAVLADCHYLVSKTDEAVPETTIEEIKGEGRVHEIARMLSGDESKVSLAHAREMLSLKYHEPEG